MKTGDMAFMDADIKDLFSVMNNSGWVRVTSACGGHIDSTHVGEENHLLLDLVVHDMDRFDKLVKTVNQNFQGVQWGGAISYDRISYKYENQDDKEAFMALVKQLFQQLKPHS